MSDSPRLASDSGDSAAPAVRTYRGRPRRRAFVITCVDEVTDRKSGFGRTLDDVLAGLAASHAASGHEFDDDHAGHDDPRDRWDEVVWEGDRVIAVVRVDGEGRLEFVRFDGADDAPGGHGLIADADGDADEG